jgi:hypothetical protein
MRSPTLGVTTVRGCTSRLLLLLGAVVGAGPGLAVASSGLLKSFGCSGKR